MTENGKCHPNLTKAEEQEYDIDPSKIKEEEDECLSKDKDDDKSTGADVRPHKRRGA